MAADPSASSIDTPSFVASPGERPRAGKWTWLASGALLVTLATMLLVAGRDWLGADAATRPLAERACAVLGCELRAWEDMTALHMLEHDVQADPATPGALRVRAGFRNDAPWPQPWPELVLTLSDAGGRPLAHRALRPADYLQDGHPALIGAGQTASVQFAVREPDRAAVAFHFAFRPHRAAAR